MLAMAHVVAVIKALQGDVVSVCPCRGCGWPSRCRVWKLPWFEPSCDLGQETRSRGVRIEDGRWKRREKVEYSASFYLHQNPTLCVCCLILSEMLSSQRLCSAGTVSGWCWYEQEFWICDGLSGLNQIKNHSESLPKTQTKPAAC